MIMPEIAHSTHHYNLYRAELIPLDMEGAALDTAINQKRAALLFEKTPVLAAVPEAGGKDEHTWVWNGRTWVWNGARLADSRTWVWNGKAVELSSDRHEAASNLYFTRNQESRLL